MQLVNIIEKAEREALTCSEMMAVLMDQPTSAAGGSATSHAHMHMQEGFSLSAYGFGGSAFSLERKRGHWETDSHLYPEGSEADFGRIVFGEDHSGRDHGYGGVMQAADRLPGDRNYVSRTGLGALPRVVRSTTTTYRVWKFPDPMGKPVEENHAGVGEAFVRALRPVGRAPNHYLPSKSTPTEPDFRVIVDEDVTRSVSASPAHTMFPDAESMVMHLTGALNAKAGRMVLKKLHQLGRGHNGTLGVFSHSAARAVKQLHPQRRNVLLERTLGVDIAGGRDHTTGLYRATGVVNRTEHEIEHVAVILGHRPTGELNVVTCYPSKETTAQALKKPASKYEDIAELEYMKDLRKVAQVILPKVVW